MKERVWDYMQLPSKTEVPAYRFNDLFEQMGNIIHEFQIVPESEITNRLKIVPGTPFSTPAVCTNSLPLGYISEVERKYNLVYYRTNPQEIDETLQIILDSKSSIHRQSRELFLQDKCDVAKFIADKLSYQTESFQ